MTEPIDFMIDWHRGRGRRIRNRSCGLEIEVAYVSILVRFSAFRLLS